MTPPPQDERPDNGRPEHHVPKGFEDEPEEPTGSTIMDVLAERPSNEREARARHLAICFAGENLLVEMTSAGRLSGRVPRAWAEGDVWLEIGSTRQRLELDVHLLFSIKLESPPSPIRFVTDLNGQVRRSEWFEPVHGD